MIDMNYNADQYYEQITSIQQSMYESERRRQELERELFAYSRSDKRISQIKCSKLRRYLKEITDREEQAKMRNLELLRDVECIEISMKKYQPDISPMEQQKADVLHKISKFKEMKINKEQEAAKKVKVTQQQDMSFTHPVNTPTLLSVVGQQTQVGITSASSDHILHHFPKSEDLPSGLLKDSRAGREGATSSQACLSDDISSSNDPPDGYNFSEEHERTTLELQTVCALTVHDRNVPFRSDEEKEPLPLITLTEAVEKPSPSNSGLMGAENPIVERTKPKESATQLPVMEYSKRGLKDLQPERTGSCESSLSSQVLSASNSTALSLSLTQSEPDEDLPESEAADQPDVMEETDNNHQKSPESSFHSKRADSPSQGITMDSLSQKELFKLLDTIEGQLHGEQIRVYSNMSIDTKEINRIISLCKTGEDLNGEDPKACGAIVLHELQRLSWSTAKGCLLSQDLVRVHQSCTKPNVISGSLPPDAAQLWDRWFKHALLLKERHVLSIEHLVQLFTPLLLERHATYSHQAKVLLRTLLSRPGEECPSAEDESDLSSFGPSHLPDCRVVKSLHKQHSPELQSSEEDSQDESPVESVPIRESKAYQLLKQSAMQERMLSSKGDDEEGEDGLSGINRDHEEDLGRAKCSLHQDPYPRMQGANSKAHSALQSKAFWGESDDSDSEIEAALCPQPFSTNNVDTDDFYD